MAYNVSINRNDNETNSSMVRRFSRKSQSANVTQRAKKKIYLERVPSKFTVKKEKLLQLKKTEEYQRLYRMGKINLSKNK